MKKQQTDNNIPIRRSFEIADLRAVDDEEKKVKRIDGHPAVYAAKANIGNWFYEIIERGAFDECDFDDVLLCVNHETRKIPLARSRRNNANSTMRLKTDNVGLFFEAELDTENNAEARQLYSSLERGDMSGMSFIFTIKEEKWENLDQDMPTRRILKLKKVYEVCAATFPAYEATDINARDQAALDNARLTLLNARSHELDNSKALDIQKLKIKIIGGLV